MTKKLTQIIDRIKAVKAISTDTEVAFCLGISKSNLFNFKKSGSIPFKNMYSFCELEGISFDWLMDGKGPQKRGNNLVVADEAPIYRTVSDDERDSDFERIPLMMGQISAGGGLVPDDRVDIKLAFKRDWIARKGTPEKMSLIKVRGDSMCPTFESGDMVLVNHGHTRIDAYGGIYAIANHDNEISVKRIQLMLPTGRVKIISDNPVYEPLEIDPKDLIINGKVIWFCRDIERE